MSNKKVGLIAFTIIVSILAYFAITLTYPFEKGLETFSNITLVLKCVFVLFNIGTIVYIILHDDWY